MGVVRAVLTAAALLLLAAKSPSPAPIDYSLGVADSHNLAVEIRFTGNPTGTTAIELPDHFTGTAELWRYISDLKVEGGTVTGDGDMRTIRHQPGAPLIVRYRVESRGDAADRSETARPTLRPDWFFFHGEGVFATVRGREAVPVGFHWGAVPAGWKLATDLEPLRRRPGRLKDLIESVGIGGRNLQILSKASGDAVLTVAVQGKWAFTAAEFLDRIDRIRVAEHRFWRERPSSFLVTLWPLPDMPGSTSYTGIGRTEAFSLLSTGNLDLNQATRVLAHEYDHRWVPRLLGGLPEQDEGRDYWFSEGFDDYLAARILLGSGLWSFSDYFSDKNVVLARYAASPARAATAAEIAGKFWQDENFERISYDRGQLLALLIDTRIRATSHGRLNLDDVLRAQRRRAGGTDLPAAALFVKMLRDATGLDMRREIASITASGRPITLPADAFGHCARVETKRLHVFTRGFDVSATQDANMAIRGVDPAGPAYAAGMRDGMRLIRREAGELGDSSREIAYRVEDKGVEKVIRYMPQSKESFEVQRVVPAVDGPTGEAACRKLLGGAG
ncbi:MAG: hypothetical protein JWO81_2838 [Alphaproteobacteria bacterium]|nr:hypothetical protein [Alphaproteobacteria bacterium]